MVPCWQCGGKLEKDRAGGLIYVLVTVRGQQVKMHKVCAGNFPKEVTAQPSEVGRYHE